MDALRLYFKAVSIRQARMANKVIMSSALCRATGWSMLLRPKWLLMITQPATVSILRSVWSEFDLKAIVRIASSRGILILTLALWKMKFIHQRINSIKLGWQTRLWACSKLFLFVRRFMITFYLRRMMNKYYRFGASLSCNWVSSTKIRLFFYFKSERSNAKISSSINTELIKRRKKSVHVEKIKGAEVCSGGVKVNTKTSELRRVQRARGSVKIAIQTNAGCSLQRE